MFISSQEIIKGLGLPEVGFWKLFGLDQQLFGLDQQLVGLDQQLFGQDQQMFGHVYIHI